MNRFGAVSAPSPELHHPPARDSVLLEHEFCVTSPSISLSKMNLRKKLNLAEEAPVIGIEALKTNVLIWLDQITLNIRKCTGTQTSRNFRFYLISRRSWYRNIKLRF